MSTGSGPVDAPWPRPSASSGPAHPTQAQMHGVDHHAKAPTNESDVTEDDRTERPRPQSTKPSSLPTTNSLTPTYHPSLTPFTPQNTGVPLPSTTPLARHKRAQHLSSHNPLRDQEGDADFFGHSSLG